MMEIVVPIVIALITSVFGPILLEWVKEKIKKKKSHDPMPESIKYNEQIEHQLDVILNELDCDQIYIAQFHNGGHFYPTGKSIQKFSVFYEVTTPNTISIKGVYQNIPVSLFSRSTNYLLEHTHLAIPDYKNEEIATLGLKYTASETNTKSGYYFAIKNIDGKFIGILGLDYCKKKVMLNDEQITTLDIEAGIISGYL